MQVLFAILAKLSAPGSRPGQLEAFLRAQPTATSIPFISWLADIEAAATGPEKQRLGSLCGLLVGAREALNAEGQGELYAACVAALGGGSAGQEGLLVSEPGVYAAKLAEAMTGQEVVREGFTPGMDALLAVAPAAALTPEGIRKGHELVSEVSHALGSVLLLRGIALQRSPLIASRAHFGVIICLPQASLPSRVWLGCCQSMACST